MTTPSDKNKVKKVSGLRVTSKQDGFRRGGRAWSGTTEIALSELSKEQLKLIRNEAKSEKPMLVVQDIQIPVA